MIDLISGGAKIGPQLLNTRQSAAVTVSLFFWLAVPSTTLTHGYFVLSPVSLASRDQDGGPVGQCAIEVYSYMSSDSFVIFGGNILHNPKSSV